MKKHLILYPFDGDSSELDIWRVARRTEKQEKEQTIEFHGSHGFCAHHQVFCVHCFIEYVCGPVTH